MKIKLRGMALLTGGLIAVAGLAGTGAAAASATDAVAYGPCAYEYQGQCYTRVTDIYTCNAVFESNTTGFKYNACVIWNQTGIVTRIK